MTNSEFLDLLVVTDKLDLSTLRKDKVALECIDKIKKHDRYIGNVYFKLLKLNNIKINEVLRIIVMIMIGFDLNYDEMDIIIKRFRYVHDIINKSYAEQTARLYVQLKDYQKGYKDLDIKEVLYDCRLGSSNKEIEYINKKGSKVYKVKFDDKIEVYDIFKIMCKDLSYIILSDKGLEFIEKGEEEIERDRYKYRVTYQRGGKNKDDK